MPQRGPEGETGAPGAAGAPWMVALVVGPAVEGGAGGQGGGLLCRYVGHGASFRRCSGRRREAATDGGARRGRPLGRGSTALSLGRHPSPSSLGATPFPRLCGGGVKAVLPWAAALHKSLPSLRLLLAGILWRPARGDRGAHGAYQPSPRDRLSHLLSTPAPTCEENTANGSVHGPCLRTHPHHNCWYVQKGPPRFIYTDRSRRGDMA